jgi:hypothetical protein
MLFQSINQRNTNNPEIRRIPMTTIPNHDLKHEHIKCCQVCGSEKLNFVIDLGHQPPCDSLLTQNQLNKAENYYPLRMYQCTSCSLAQIDYVVPPEVLFYAEYPYRSGITSTLADNLRGTGFMAVEKFSLQPQDLAIDIGSNDGTLLSGFKDAGLQVLGIEPTNICQIANENGIRTIQKFFSEEIAGEVVAEFGHASVVTAANMFAHVEKLGSLIRGVEQLLKDGGVFISESHYLPSLLEKVQYDSIYHEHLKYYTLKSLIQLFSYYNFTVIDVELIENYGGSIRVYAVKGRGRPVSPAVAELLDVEEQQGIYTFAPFEFFVDRVRNSKAALLELMVNAKRDKKTIVGVGCPGRSSTLVNYCGIDKEMMPYIAEQSTSLKLGLYLPGKHIPIIDEKEMLENQPDYALILSWHYWEPIVKNLRKKGLKSKIVIPLPELRILD